MPRSLLRPTLLAAAVAVAFLTSCAPSRSSSANPFDGSSSATTGTGAETPIQVEVQNLNFNDVTIWAVRQGQRIRLGRVTGKTDETFRMRWNPAFPISFNIDVTGGRSCSTIQVGVDPDARVWVSIPSTVGSQECRAGRR